MRKFQYFIFFISFGSIFCDFLENGRNESAEQIYKNECVDFSGEIDIDSQIVLESPNYPGDYPENLNCTMIIGDEGCPLTYSIKFIEFDLENSTGCIKDRLEIDEIDALCGLRNGTTKKYYAKNGKLTLNFITDSEINKKGFKILVKKIGNCQKPITGITTLLQTPNIQQKLCCNHPTQNSKNFFIKTPNFPSSLSSPNDCVIRIEKFSANICRLRIKFSFFWFGNSLSCNEGFLQIDGKFICGCKKELNLISSFEENVKLLRFKSEGIVKNSYSGFIAEVFQDECPRKIETEFIDKNVRNQRKFEKQTYLTPYELEKSEVYVFTYPEEAQFKRDKEETDYLDTKEIESFIGNNIYDYNSCLEWNQIQFNNINQDRMISVQSERCIENNKNKIDDGKRCLEFFQRAGLFFSPGYPFFYPGNLNICYRFLRLPGYCAVRIHFLDFRIGFDENICTQDNLEIRNKGTFCGRSLWNKIVTLDFENSYEDIYFNTKNPSCIQGFKAIFEQIPCREVTTEIPLPPFTRNWPVTPPSTIPPPKQCGKVIRDQFVTLTKDFDSTECTFIIEKYSDEICRIIIHFDNLNFDCSTEFFTINKKKYCGSYTGTREFFEVYDTPIEMHYKSHTFGNPKGFKIRVVQDSSDCFPEPPAQLSK